MIEGKFSGERLKNIRKDFGYSLDKVSDLTGISKSYLWQLLLRSTR